MDAADQLEIVARVLLAAVLGAFIGLEREIRGYPAGVRTMALVALGAALFTEISLLTSSEDRIAAGIVTGIGFLGAGVIFREGYTVKGITTAATIWGTAAIGMAVGHELYLVAVLGTALVFALLEARPVVRVIENLLNQRVRLLIDQEEGDERRDAERQHDER